MIKCSELSRKECQSFPNSVPLCHIPKFGSAVSAWEADRYTLCIKPEGCSFGTAECTGCSVCVTTDRRACLPLWSGGSPCGAWWDWAHLGPSLSPAPAPLPRLPGGFYGYLSTCGQQVPGNSCLPGASVEAPRTNTAAEIVSSFPTPPGGTSGGPVASHTL